MSTPRASHWLIDASDETVRGLLKDFSSSGPANEPRFPRNRRGPITLRVGEKDPTGRRPFRDLDLTGAQFKVGVGNPDEPPTGGKFTLSFNGNSSAVANLDFPISEDDLETALNLNEEIDSAGGVTVAKSGNLYAVTFNNPGAQSLFTFDATRLTPPSTILVVEEIAGDVSTNAVQSLEFRQLNLARVDEDDWTIETTGSVSKTQTSAGTTTTPAAWKVSLTPEPLSGSIAFAYGRKRKVRVNVNRANTVTGHLTTVTITGTPAQGEFFTAYDSSGPVLFWFDYDDAGTSQPTTPSGGRKIRVDCTTGDSQAAIAAHLSVAATETHFSGTMAGYKSVAIRCLDAGERSDSDPGSAGESDSLTLTNDEAGDDGALAGEWAAWSDRNGTVAIWISSNGSAMPSAAAAFDRQIKITATANATASTVATAIETTVDPDAEFSAVAAGDLVNITDASNGARTGTVSSSTWLSIAELQPGAGFNVSVPVDSSETQVQDLVGSDFAVTELAPFSWAFTRTANGTEADADFTATASSIAWPNFAYTEDFAFNSLILRQHFAATTGNTLNAFLEVKMKLTGETNFRIILQIPVTLFKDLLADTEAVALPYETAASIEEFARRFRFAYKAADQTCISDTTVNADPDLVIAAAANEALSFELFLVVTGSAGDLKCGMTFPSTPTQVWWEVFKVDADLDSALAFVNLLDGDGSGDISVNISSTATVRIVGTLINGANAGNIQFHWSQNTSNVSPTTLCRGSRMEARLLNP